MAAAQDRWIWVLLAAAAVRFNGAEGPVVSGAAAAVVALAVFE